VWRIQLTIEPIMGVEAQIESKVIVDEVVCLGL
jgi:hypothetical protein